MAYELRIRRQAGHLHVRVTGDNDRETIEAYLNEVQARCEKMRCREVLIEENLRGPSISITELYEIVTALSGKAAPFFRRIAYVDVNPEHDHDRIRFAGDVAANRGVNVSIFKTAAQAAEWLEEKTAAR